VLSLRQRWFVACALAGTSAAAVTVALGHAVSQLDPETAAPLLWLPMLAAGALEGAVVGALQAWALPGVAARPWTLRTILAFTLAWLGGMLASLFEPSSPPSFGVVLTFAAVAGGILGALVGALQLRDRPWALASAAGFAGWMVVAAIAADHVAWGPLGARGVVTQLVGGCASGLVLATSTAPLLTRALTRAA